MESRLKNFLRLNYDPVVVIWSIEKPSDAIEFRPGKWGCVMWWFVSAAKGKTAVFSRETYGCWGGGVGLGFGNVYKDFPGGIDCFCRFLSSGNVGNPAGEAVAEQIKPYVTNEFMENFLHGEGYLASPKNVSKFIESLPIVDIPAKYVIFKVLSQVDLNFDKPKVVVFLVEPAQLSALIVLAHYNSSGECRVFAPFSAGCQTIGIWAYPKDEKDIRKGVIGLTDISARLNVKKQIGSSFLTFAVPWEFFVELEEEAPQGFLVKNTWKNLISD